MTEVEKPHLVLMFSNGERWALPTRVISHHRASYYAAKDPDTTYTIEYDYTQSKEGEDELYDWVRNNMNWNELVPHCVLLPSPLHKFDYEAEWSDGAVKAVVR